MLYRITRKLMPPGMQFSSIVIFAIKLDNTITETVPGGDNLQYQCVVSPQDSLLTLLTDAYPARQFRLRLLQGTQQVYLITARGQLAAYAWVTTSGSDISEIHFSFKVSKGSLYIYDCYVTPEFRGQGLYKALLRKILSDYSRMSCSGEPFRTASIAAECGNTASLRGITSIGFREIARATYISVGRHSRLFGPGDLSEIMRISDLSTPEKMPSDNQHDAR